MPVSIRVAIPELYEAKESKEIDLKNIIVKNFFTKKKREMKSMSCKKGDDGGLSDRDTDWSHNTIYRSAKKL